ncbi:hypothetical protein [Oceanicaulis sp. MMSF_3324]|uniref:hypothetical protein n=1 Tax=Oceanicaulis sp. MMSF_3324 TaxID=3046702 RepID=UPI00273D8A4D|nr:hypothetical protein [Oceanicaulis sp. MMSF_3324]
MSADKSRPDAAEPVDAEFEPAPDSGGSTAKSKSKKSKPSTKGKGGTPVLAFIGLTVLAAGVGGGAGWLIGHYTPSSGDTAPNAELVNRIEALENQTVTTDQLNALQARLEAVEDTTAGAPLRTDAFEQLIRDVADLRNDLEAIETSGGSTELSAVTTRLSTIERRLDTIASDAETALATAETTQSALQQMRNQSASGSNDTSASLPSDQISSLRRDIASMQADIRALQDGQGDLDSLTSRLAALEAVVSGLPAETGAAASPAASTSLARQALAFSDLAQAAAHSQPFAMEYAMLSQVWPDRREINALTEAARTGAPTLDDLADSFPAQQVREALGQTQRLWGVIEVRRTGDDQGIADQILTHLEQGELSAAINLADSIDADAGLAPWLVDARKREALDAALEDMRQTLARQADANGER